MGILEIISPTARRKKISKELYNQFIKKIPSDIKKPWDYSEYLVPLRNKTFYEGSTLSKELPFRGLTFEDANKLQRSIERKIIQYKEKSRREQEKKLQKLQGEQEFRKEAERAIELFDERLMKLKYGNVKPNLQDLYKLKKIIKEDLNFLREKYKPDYERNEQVFDHLFGTRAREIKGLIKETEKKSEEERKIKENYEKAKKCLLKEIKGKSLAEAIKKYSKDHFAGSVNYIEKPPEKLYHGVSEFFGEDISGRGKTKNLRILLPKDYVNRVKKILKDGLKPSFRWDQVASDNKIQANYFLDKPSPVYGLLGLEINGGRFQKEIFSTIPLGRVKEFYDKEYLIYTTQDKPFAGDFTVFLLTDPYLNKIYKPYLDKIGITFDQYITNIKEELEKAKIPYKEIKELRQEPKGDSLESRVAVFVLFILGGIALGVTSLTMTGWVVSGLTKTTPGLFGILLFIAGLAGMFFYFRKK